MQRINHAIVSLWMDPLGEELYYTISLYDGEPPPAWASAPALETDARPSLDMEQGLVGADAAMLIRVEERTATEVDSARIPPEVLRSLFRGEMDAEEWVSRLPEEERKKYVRRRHSFSASFSLIGRQGERHIGSVGWSRWVD